MRELIPACIIAGAVVIGSLLIGGRYEIVPSQANTVARLDRLSGKVEMCIVGAGSACGFVVDPTKPQEEAAAQKVPPCRDGALECKPWERDWPEGASDTAVLPGSVMTDDGTVIPPTGSR